MDGFSLALAEVILQVLGLGVAFVGVVLGAVGLGISLAPKEAPRPSQKDEPRQN